MLIVALVLAVIGLAALVTAVATSNEIFAWACIGVSAVGVLLLIADAIRERQRRPVAVPPAVPVDGDAEETAVIAEAETTEVMQSVGVGEAESATSEVEPSEQEATPELGAEAAVEASAEDATVEAPGDDAGTETVVTSATAETEHFGGDSGDQGLEVHPAAEEDSAEHGEQAESNGPGDAGESDAGSLPEPDVAEPDTAEPDVAEPDAQNPDAAEPDGPVELRDTQ